MTDPSIFGNQSNQGNEPSQQQQQTQNVNPLATLLADIKNENGQQKYQSAEEALRGAAHAQEYIRTLQREKAEAEARLTALASKEDKTVELERTLAELMQKVNKPAEPASNVPTGDDIAAIVAKTLDSRSAAETAKSNQDAVAAVLLKSFGAEAETKYNEAAQELGLTPAEMNQLAAKSPKAVLKALGVSEQVAKPQSFAPANSTFNTAALQPHQDSFVGRNKDTVAVGATTGDMMAESARARKMAEELHANGLTAADLSDPKVYHKYFK
jgi:head-tail adaptor